MLGFRDGGEHFRIGTVAGLQHGAGIARNQRMPDQRAAGMGERDQVRLEVCSDRMIGGSTRMSRRLPEPRGPGASPD